MDYIATNLIWSMSFVSFLLLLSLTFSFYHTTLAFFCFDFHLADDMFLHQASLFVQVMENKESHGILGFHFPGLEIQNLLEIAVT